MNNLIAITIGDIKGIGIHILISTWKKNKLRKFILFTNISILKNFLKKNNIKIKINIINKNNKLNFKFGELNIYSFKCKSLEDNTIKSLKYAYNFCNDRFCIGIITLPLRKDLIKNKVDKSFVGHTEFFQKINKKKYSNMILYNDKIIISTLTTHIRITDVAKIIKNKVFLYNQILNLHNALKLDFNFKKPKIIISGLNPHSGENGKVGKEEIQSIKPTLVKLKKKGVKIDGPYSADSILLKENIKKYDCFIFMYHDQALIPFKLISKFSGVNYTGNLDIIRTSPDHGTAYNMVGSKSISNKSFLNCVKLIKKIHKNRYMNEKS